jgi:cbb3-type cytochrome oxidase subunit 3
MIISKPIVFVCVVVKVEFIFRKKNTNKKRADVSKQNKTSINSILKKYTSEEYRKQIYAALLIYVLLCFVMHEISIRHI